MDLIIISTFRSILTKLENLNLDPIKRFLRAYIFVFATLEVLLKIGYNDWMAAPIVFGFKKKFRSHFLHINEHNECLIYWIIIQWIDASAFSYPILYTIFLSLEPYVQTKTKTKWIEPILRHLFEMTWCFECGEGYGRFIVFGQWSVITIAKESSVACFW